MKADRATGRMADPMTSGFSMLELLTAIAGAGVLAAALGSVLSSQVRFHGLREDVIQGEQTTRVLLDAMVAELRAVSATDLIVASPDSVRTRFDLMRGVVCEAHPDGSVDVFFYDTTPAPNVPPRFRGTAVSGPYTASYTYSDGGTPSMGGSAAAETVCRANGADANRVAPRTAFRRTGGWGALTGTAPTKGTVVRIYGSLTYSVANAAGGTKAVRRNGQEFVTELDPAAGFEYELTDGTVVSQVAPQRLKDVREVRLNATAGGRNDLGTGRSLSYSAWLRN